MIDCMQFCTVARGAEVLGELWTPLVVEHHVADLCRDDPGHDVSVLVHSTVRALTEIWTGDSAPEQEIRSGDLTVQGAGRNGQRLWQWLGRSMFAPTRMAQQR
ncbi:MAG: hypothetical protein C4535_12455 [Comamonadaceae bacterium]|jgi:hypothetical protein|nr:MAG: hypothetical protein C4535_12455 [Comamonadaceae bacterium]